MINALTPNSRRRAVPNITSLAYTSHLTAGWASTGHDAADYSVRRPNKLPSVCPEVPGS